MSHKQKQLFKTRIVPGREGSGKLFEEEFVTDNGPVECLGMTFEDDEKRREYFLNKLREKLKDPEFRKIEGFPIGEDEDILALSDPPYYTACPNPFIEDFIKHYGKPYDPETDDYRREPFAADVSEGVRTIRATTPTPTIPRCRIRRSCGTSCTILNRAISFLTDSVERG